jgi:hypothetical protein
VLIREDKEDYVDCELDETSLDGDAPILWEVSVVGTVRLNPGMLVLCDAYRVTQNYSSGTENCD